MKINTNTNKTWNVKCYVAPAPITLEWDRTNGRIWRQILNPFLKNNQYIGFQKSNVTVKFINKHTHTHT